MYKYTNLNGEKRIIFHLDRIFPEKVNTWRRMTFDSDQLFDAQYPHSVLSRALVIQIFSCLNQQNDWSIIRFPLSSKHESKGCVRLVLLRKNVYLIREGLWSHPQEFVFDSEKHNRLILTPAQSKANIISGWKLAGSI